MANAKYDKYKKDPKYGKVGIEVTDGMPDEVWDNIANTARQDVKNDKPPKTRKDFKNEKEYDAYLLALFEAVVMAEYGVL